MIVKGRAKIIQVGGFNDDGYPVHWHFDCRGMSDEDCVEVPSPSLCGYSLEELREIAEQEIKDTGSTVWRLSEGWRSLPEEARRAA